MKFIKQFVASAFLVWISVPGAWAQTSEFWINDGVVREPPMIDARNVVNRGTIDLFLTGGLFSLFGGIELFDTSNTLNFTNRNVMRSSPGFLFDTAPAASGVRRMAANFHNAGLVNPFNASITGGTHLLVSATNVFNRGLLTAGGMNRFLFFSDQFFFIDDPVWFDGQFQMHGLLQIKGHHVDLYRSSVQTHSIPSGRLIDYWGLGEMDFNRGVFNIPASPVHDVTQLFSTGYMDVTAVVSAAGGEAHANVTIFSPTEMRIQVVFLLDQSVEMIPEVRFSGAVPIIEWRHEALDLTTGRPVTNFIHFSDFLSVIDDDDLELIGEGGVIFRPRFRPNNYELTFGRDPNFLFEFGQPGNEPYDPDLFAGDMDVDGAVYSAWGLTGLRASELPDFSIPGAGYTNLPGRVEIIADNFLNLRRTRVEAMNYTLLQATNHFVGQTREGLDRTEDFNLLSPFSDLHLGSTNGNMTVWRLVPPILPRVEGQLRAWSGRWTTEVDVDEETIEIDYHVLVVNSAFESGSIQPQIQDLSLRSRNVAAPGALNDVVIEDQLNVFRSLLVDAERLMLTEEGALHISSPEIVWSTAMPRLRFLTNEGSIQAANAVYFGGARREPHFDGSWDEPYDRFVNSGSIWTHGNLIWAHDFQNTGDIASQDGPTVVWAGNASISDGLMTAFDGDMMFEAATLTVTNSIFDVARSLVFSITNQFTDGVQNVPGAVPAGNFWNVRDGVHLLHKPETGDLLGTEITSRAFQFMEVSHVWGAHDRGPTVEGFVDNAAVGRLILDADFRGAFRFTGTGANNALYVDFLEFRNYATNRNDSGELIALRVDPNMRVYFAASNLPEDKLEEGNSGLVWVPEYAGLYSSVTLTYPSGQMHRFNRGLIDSCEIDSNGNGIPNCLDPMPILTADSVKLSLGLATEPEYAAVISWDAPAHSKNTLYYQSQPGPTGWQVLTNITQGPVNGRITVVDPITDNGPRFYRVGIE